MNNIVIGLIVAIAALVLDIISTAIPYWWRVSAGNASSNYGLFQVCGSIGSTSACASYTSTPDYLQASGAMMIISILALGAAVLAAILLTFVMKDKSMLAVLAAVAAIIGGVLCCIGFIIFAAKFKLIAGGLHASFGLAIIAAIAAFVAGGLFFMGRNAVN